MTNETRETITWVLGTLVALSALVAIVVRTWLLPYLREQLIRPVRETHHQVTVNGGTSPVPTLLDKVTAVGDEVTELRHDFTSHLVASTNESAAMWRAIEAVANARPPDPSDK